MIGQNSEIDRKQAEANIKAGLDRFFIPFFKACAVVLVACVIAFLVAQFLK